MVELDFRRVEQAKTAQFPVIFGDVSQEVVLKAAKVKEARLLLITVPAIVTTQTIVDQVRRINPSLHIVARTEGIEQMKILHDQGVYEAVQPEFEASLELTRQALLHLDIPATEIHRFTDAVRKDLYAPLYQRQSNYDTLKQLQNARHLLELHWISLPTGSPLISKMIKDLAIRSKTGVSVVGVMRHGKVHPNPDASYRFASGDLLAVMGDAQQLAVFQEWVQQETT